jgi:hypothetical protein
MAERRASPWPPREFLLDAAVDDERRCWKSSAPARWRRSRIWAGPVCAGSASRSPARSSPDWLRLANALLGNDEDAPAIEFFAGGLSVRALESPVQIALAGHFAATLTAPEASSQSPSWRSVTLAPGETLRCGMLSAGRVGYVALAGMRVPQQLGSASTYARAGLGGLDGRLLAPVRSCRRPVQRRREDAAHAAARCRRDSRRPRAAGRLLRRRRRSPPS